jgi:folate-dependent phosphoribosylglycinamide formyltransferase PurN
MTDVALLCGRSDTSLAVAHRLRAHFGDVAILVEDKESRSRFLKRRVKRLGLLQVGGQLAFQAIAVPLLKRLSRRRIEQIKAAGGIVTDASSIETAEHVSSVNSEEALVWLQSVRPKVVVVNGTRIISKRILSATDAVFINTHCGITPEYRGAHGGYWALANRDRANCGVTIHLVDQGVDTGAILCQQRIEPTASDNFVTYPYLQIAAALPHLVETVSEALEGRHSPQAGGAQGGLWYHPTLWQYLRTGIARKVW